MDRSTADAAAVIEGAPIYVGVDVGGTHTDVSAIVGDHIERGKALTTYDDFSRGVIDATAVVAEKLELSTSDLLARTKLFINGTTVVTNAITELSGARVGILVTEGFRDTFRFGGGPRDTELDDHLQVNLPDLVDRSAIEEVRERIDYAGEVVVPLDEDLLEQSIRRLIEEEGVEAIAVCFLSSYVNADHEAAATTMVERLYPDVFVSASHKLFPVMGENRRWTTAVLNAFVVKRTHSYLNSVEQRLRAAGLDTGLAFFQGLGGGVSAEKAREFPLSLLGSGPAGGAIGANALARRMGRKRVLLGDMGGTSFDTGLVHDNEVRIGKNVELGPFQTGINLVDVVSVGAGGGSIVWVGERGVPRIGPQSAGSTPGPAAYGQGGMEPTVTDAMVALGFIDPDRYLGGRFELRRDLAEKALEQTLGERFGWSVDESAAAVHDLVVVSMANAVREVSIEKGHDPRDFVFLAYGGTLPLFAMQIADRLKIDTVIVPQHSSVFSALGLLAADFVLRYDQAVGWDLSRTDDVERVNAVADRMIGTARDAMRSQGFADEDIEIRRSADFRFAGQSYELQMPLPNRPLNVDDAPRLAGQFLELYEQTYGEGTAWKGVPSVLLNHTVTVTGTQARPETGRRGGQADTGGDPVLGERELYLPSERRRDRVPVYDDARLAPGSSVSGPAIIDVTDTTIYVPPGATAVRDDLMNYVLSRNGGAQ